MNNQTRSDARDIIESRIAHLIAETESVIGQHGISCELTAYIDMAHLCDAISLHESRSYQERQKRILDGQYKQWQTTNLRVG